MFRSKTFRKYPCIFKSSHLSFFLCAKNSVLFGNVHFKCWYNLSLYVNLIRSNLDFWGTSLLFLESFIPWISDCEIFKLKKYLYTTPDFIFYRYLHYIKKMYFFGLFVMRLSSIPDFNDFNGMNSNWNTLKLVLIQSRFNYVVRDIYLVNETNQNAHLQVLVIMY